MAEGAGDQGGPVIRGGGPWRVVLPGVVVLALVLRLLLLPLHWNPWEIDYLALVWPHWDGLGRGELGWSRLVGLHPGQSWIGLAMLLRAGLPAGLVVLVPIGVALVTTVEIAGWAKGLSSEDGGPRAAVAAGLAFAVAPLAVAYGLELNNYPWAALALVLLGRGLDGSRASPTSPLALVRIGAGAILGVHAHALFWPVWVVALGVAGMARDRLALLVLLAVGAVAIPVAGALLGAAGSVGNPEAPGIVEALSMWVLALERFEPRALSVGLLLLLLLGLGGRRARVAALLASAWCLSLLLAAGLGAASPWQCPYLLPPLATLLAPAVVGLLGDRGIIARIGACAGLLWGAAALVLALHPATSTDGVEVERRFLGPAPAVDRAAASSALGALPEDRLLVRVVRPALSNDDPRYLDVEMARLPRSWFRTFAPRDAGAPGFCFEGTPGRTCVLPERLGDPDQPELRAVLAAAAREGRDAVVLWPSGAQAFGGDAERAALAWAVGQGRPARPWRAGMSRGTWFPAP